MSDKEWTATVYIFSPDGRTLLIKHPRLQRWMPPGGHVNPGELPSEAAIREAYEECGLTITLYDQNPITFASPCVQTFPRPYLCQLEEIPSFKGAASHQHIDLIYLGFPVEEEIPIHSPEGHDMRWFTWSELQTLCPESEILPEVFSLLAHLYHKESDTPTFATLRGNPAKIL